MKKVTIMIFMAADNNLDLFASKDINEMMGVGSSDSINIIAEVDRRRAFLNESEPSQMNTKRYFIEKGKLTEVGDLGETNTGDFRTLQDFINWGIQNYPAEAYFVDIWNHGGGVKDEEIYERYNRKMKRPFFRSFEQEQDVRWVASDDTSRDFLDMQELRKALIVSERIYVVGFDACLMAGFEAMYQLKGIADYMVASQEVEPLDGWDYANSLQGIENTISSNMEQFPKKLVQSYIKTYSTTDKNVTLSAIEINRIEDLGSKISKLAEVLLNGFSDTEYGILKAANHVQKFRDGDYIDLLDFATLCKQYIDKENVKAATTELIDSIHLAVIENGYKNIDNAHGISILLPYQKLNKQTKQLYLSLDYTKDYPNWFLLIENLGKI